MDRKPPSVIVRKETDSQKLVIAVKAKIVEEALELATADTRDKIIEEAADLLEALHTLLKLKGISIEEVEETRRNKRTRVGGFDKGYIVYWLDKTTC